MVSDWLRIAARCACLCDFPGQSWGLMMYKVFLGVELNFIVRPSPLYISIPRIRL